MLLQHMRAKHPNLSTFGHHYKSTRARDLSFKRNLEEVLNPLIPSGGKPGVCGPDSLAQSLGMSAVTVHNQIQAFMGNEQNKERLQPLSHMTSEEWDILAAEPATIWKTDLDFLWIASHAFETDIYLFSVVWGVRLFSEIVLPLKGQKYMVCRALSVDECNATDWADVVRKGSIVMAYNRCHFYSMLLRVDAPPGAGVRPRRRCANYAAGAMKQ
jgi:hypothetical protein